MEDFSPGEWKRKKRFEDLPPGDDYRPAVRRMLELFKNVPKEKWASLGESSIKDLSLEERLGDLKLKGRDPLAYVRPFMQAFPDLRTGEYYDAGANAYGNGDSHFAKERTYVISTGERDAKLSISICRSAKPTDYDPIKNFNFETGRLSGITGSSVWLDVFLHEDKEEETILVGKDRGDDAWRILGGSEEITKKFEELQWREGIDYLVKRFILGQQEQQEDIDPVVDATISTLFVGNEREQMERQLKDARLNVRKGWASVPRLNLGSITLPTPGQGDVHKDEFVVSGGSLLIEYLAGLNVMSREQAEAIVAQRLENYFVHRSGFQMSRNRAEEILSGLSSPDRPEEVTAK